MKKLLAVSFLLLGFIPITAAAELKPGNKSPDFTAPATLGGHHFTFSLSEALKKGPVVLYFYPAAFTTGCTIEAHEFAAAIPKFKALGASVIGVSHDDIPKLDRFSKTDCKKKFPVAADADQHIMKAYDAVTGDSAYANRTSYVIAPTGEILYVYSDGDPTKHVENTMAAVKQWDDAHPRH